MEETPKKPAPGKSEFAKLIEVMESNNKSTDKIEIDGRNVRRHLLEMKNMQKVMNDFQARTVFGFENFQDMIDSQKLGDLESERERMGIFEEIRDELRNQSSTGPISKSDNSSGGGGKGIMGNMMSSKIGAILSGVGIAAAGIGFGLAAVMSQAPKLIKTFEDMDVNKIQKNFDGLLSINEQAGGNKEMLKDGGSLAFALGQIGIGLAALSIGTGASVAVDKFAGDSDFVGKIKANVEGLLGITKLEGAGLGEGGTAAFVATMTGLGLGLAVFALGKAGASTAEAIKKFTAGDNFAEGIVNEVRALLTINSLPGAEKGNATKFVKTMTGLGVGLMMFALGKGASGVADAVTTFQGKNFGQDIKDEVETLLSITKLEGIGFDTAKFTGVMSGLAAGLVAFSVGKASSGVADAFTKFTAGDNFAEDIKKEVETLLTIGQGADIQTTKNATLALTELGLGLAAFAGGKGANALADLKAGVVKFLTGGKSPIDQAIALGEKHATVQKGADAFQDFADALNSFSRVNLDFNAEKFAKQLFNAAQTLELAFEGGSAGGFLGFGGDKLVGITNMQADMDAAVDTITKLRGSLDMSTATVSMSVPSPIEGMAVNTLSVENAILKIPQTSSSGGASIIAKGGDSVRTGDTILINNNSSTVTDSLNIDR